MTAADATLVAGAASVWELAVGDEDGSTTAPPAAFPVFLIKLDGRPLLDADRDAVLAFYRGDIATRERFATFYDMSEGLPEFIRHVLPMIQFCRDMKPITSGRLQYTVVVCPNVMGRSVLNLILRAAPPPAPIYVVESTDAAWKVVASREDAEVYHAPSCDSLGDALLRQAGAL